MLYILNCLKDRTSLLGVWFPAHSNVTCTGKCVKIDPTNQWTRITIYDNFIGWLVVLTLWAQETKWHWMYVYSNSRSGSAVRNHCRTHPALCVRPRCVCSFLRAHVQFCRFDKADATAYVQWHCNHRPPLWYHYFPAQSSLSADILVYWIGKIVQTCDTEIVNPPFIVPSLSLRVACLLKPSVFGPTQCN